MSSGILRQINPVCLWGGVPITSCVNIPVVPIIFISASQEDRIARLCRIHGISEEAAAEKMNKADKKRSELL